MSAHACPYTEVTQNHGQQRVDTVVPINISRCQHWNFWKQSNKCRPRSKCSFGKRTPTQTKSGIMDTF